MLRDRVFYTSVQKFLEPDERIIHTVHMWTRHRWAVPYAVLTGVVMTGLAAVVGVTQWTGRIGVGFAAAALGAAASTDYRILTQTSKGLVLLRSSRVRQKAVALITRLPKGTTIRLVGNNLVITEWEVGDSVYSVMKRFQKPMVAISQS